MLDVSRHGNLGPLNTLPKPATKQKKTDRRWQRTTWLWSPSWWSGSYPPRWHQFLFVKLMEFPKFVVQSPNLRYSILTCWEDTLCASGEPTQLDFGSLETLNCHPRKVSTRWVQRLFSTTSSCSWESTSLSPTGWRAWHAKNMMLDLSFAFRIIC